MKRALLLLAAAACGSSTSHPPNGYTFVENFTSDGASWPAAWTALGGVASASVAGGRGIIVPAASGYSLGRMGASASQRDVEVTFQLRFEDVGTQGVGFYVRQNGHYLQAAAVHGQGYAIFVEGYNGSQVGVWRELDGVESEIASFNFSTPLASNTTYAARFRVTQATASSTRLQARVWAAAQAEPSAWQVDATDGIAELQGASGGFAVDSYSPKNSGITAATSVGNILVVGL